MPYVSTFNRNQMMMCSWDSFVDPESIARLIDAFVNSLDLTKYEVKEAAKEGRPAYDPKGMYKLYIYMVTVKVSDPHVNWLKAVKSILK